jgi:hypothetical protein
MMSSGEEMGKTCAKEDFHEQAAPCRSSYIAQMKNLEKDSSSDFTVMEDNNEELGHVVATD